MSSLKELQNKKEQHKSIFSKIYQYFGLFNISVISRTFTLSTKRDVKNINKWLYINTIHKMIQINKQ